jgi:hypothetical protein
MRKLRVITKKIGKSDVKEKRAADIHCGVE